MTVVTNLDQGCRLNVNFTTVLFVDRLFPYLDEEARKARYMIHVSNLSRENETSRHKSQKFVVTQTSVEADKRWFNFIYVDASTFLGFR